MGIGTIVAIILSLATLDVIVRGDKSFVRKTLADVKKDRERGSRG